MTNIQIIDGDRNPMATVTPEVASRMEGNFEVTRTTNPTVRRFLSEDERNAARRAHVRRITGLAHPHDKVGDDIIEAEFDNWVAECGQEVFI